MRLTDSLTIALVTAVALAVAGCSNFSRFRPYTAGVAPIPGVKQTVRINLWNVPEDFSIYKRDEHPRKYDTPIRDYLTGAIKKEFAAAGFKVTEARDDRRAITVDAYVNQFDLGYEKYWWTTGIYFIGYSRVNVLAIADLSVEVTLPKGQRYRRRFVSRSSDRSRLLWIGLALPVIPVPISGFYDEAEQVELATAECLRRVVRSVDELLRAYGG